jgi:hypothetical protein
MQMMEATFCCTPKKKFKTKQKKYIQMMKASNSITQEHQNGKLMYKQK